VIKSASLASISTEVIVVDNGSKDNSAQVVKDHKIAKWVPFDQNYGFGDGYNRAVKMTKTDIVVLLNTDIQTEGDFFSPLYKELEDDKVFAVGAYQRVVAGDHEYDDGGTVAEWKRGLLRHRPVFEMYPDRKFSDPINTFYVSGGAGAFNRQKFLDLGGFSPIFRPFYWEDADLCFRAWKKGWKSIFVPKSRCIHHHESTTSMVATPLIKKAHGWKGAYLFTWRAIDNLPMLLVHLFWMPFHVVNALVHRRWEQFWGFWLALKYILVRIKSGTVTTAGVIKNSSNWLN
jgi:GT2 family glycosyltransferase